MRLRLNRLGITALTLIFAGSACSSGSVGYTPVQAQTPVPLASIQHVIVLVQENRSFVNLFMGYPGADAPSEGACKPNPALKLCLDGKPVKLRPITLESTGKPGFGKDIGHDHSVFETEFDGGKMDGFNGIRLGTGGMDGPAKLYPYAYVVKNQTKPYWNLAKSFTLGDRMFSTETSDSFTAHQQLIAGTTRLNAQESVVDTPDGFPWGCDAPAGTTVPVIKLNGAIVTDSHVAPCFTQYKTMADVLDASNVSWKFYVDAFEGNDADFSGEVWNAFDAIKSVRHGPDWKKNVSEPNTNLFTDIKNRRLPAVSWVIPSLADSDHPASGSNTGPSWVTSIVNAVGKSSYWKNTAIVVVWDDWGGWYDNVPPPQPDYTSLSMRVPLLVISPWAKRGYISHTEYNFGSILKFVEQNFGTGSLGATDATANSIGDVFDYTQTPPGFHPFVAPYDVNFFQHHRPSPSARWFLEKSGALPD